MPTITTEGKTFEVVEGANLREALLAQDITLYSEGASVFNCHGHGGCGTCVVLVEGAVSDPTKPETARMAVPPHSAHPERRLACQVKIMGNVRVTKFDGYFGEGDRPIWTPEQALADAPATVTG